MLMNLEVKDDNESVLLFNIKGLKLTPAHSTQMTSYVTRADI